MFLVSSILSFNCFQQQLPFIVSACLARIFIVQLRPQRTLLFIVSACMTPIFLGFFGFVLFGPWRILLFIVGSCMALIFLSFFGFVLFGSLRTLLFIVCARVSNSYYLSASIMFQHDRISISGVLGSFLR